MRERHTQGTRAARGYRKKRVRSKQFRARGGPARGGAGGRRGRAGAGGGRPAGAPGRGRGAGGGRGARASREARSPGHAHITPYGYGCMGGRDLLASLVGPAGHGAVRTETHVSCG